MSDKVLVAIAFISFVFASGEVQLTGVKGLLFQVIYSTICMLICLFSLAILSNRKAGKDGKDK